MMQKIRDSASSDIYRLYDINVYDRYFNRTRLCMYINFIYQYFNVHLVL